MNIIMIKTAGILKDHIGSWDVYLLFLEGGGVAGGGDVVAGGGKKSSMTGGGRAQSSRR